MTTLVRIVTEEWPDDQWIGRGTPLGPEPFVMIEGDPSKTEFLDDDSTILALSVTVGGGFTEKNLAKLLRGLADVLEIQERSSRVA
jgi:hypothetical protein